MRELWNRLRDRLRRDRLDAELAEELRFHQRLLERDAGSAGGESAARRRLGNVTSIRETARDRWSLGWLDAFLQDVRHALRGLRKSPSFSAAVILTLALGVGANAAMFGIIDRLMFRPFPYLADPGSVNRVYLRWHDRNRTLTISDGIEYTRYLDLQRGTTSFSQFAAFTQEITAVGIGDDAKEREVAPVSASFFAFFKMRPAIGRFFVASDDSVPRGAAVAVLGYGFWQSEFGGRDVLGQTLQVGSVLVTIVGVAPKGFTGVSDAKPPAVYLPITTVAASSAGGDGDNYYNTYHWGWVQIMARRKPGITPATASADLTHAYRQSWIAERASGPGLTPVDLANPSAIASALKTGAGPDPDRQALSAVWVGGVAVIVLLIACANVTNLFLVRAMRRRRETAVRLALGVTRRRLLAQSITESLVLSTLAGVGGMLVAQWGSAAIRSFFGYDSESFSLLNDWRTIAVTGAIAVTIGVITGTVPALLVGRGALAAALKTGVRAGIPGRSRLSGSLLIAQAALSMMLLVGAGLFVRSMMHVRAMHMGYDFNPVLLVNSNRRGPRLSDSGEVALSHELLTTAQALPDVLHAAWIASLPFYSSMSTNLAVAGIDSVGRLGRFTYETTTADYFATMGTRIIRGRGLSTDDRTNAPRVAVVSESMARVLWPGRDAIGQCMAVGDTKACTTVVGIAEDAIQSYRTDAPHFHFYLPIAQFQPANGFGMLLRMRGDPATQGEGVRRALQRIMPGQYYVSTQPLRQLIDAEREPWEFGATMFAAFGVLALIVAGIGLYALIAYGVAQRLHELGVRIALGAQAHDVMRLVMSQGLAFALSGVVLGGLLALVAAHWVQPLLFEESPRDPLVFGAVTVLLLAVAVLACASPAWRASRADPNAALRTD